MSRISSLALASTLSIFALGVANTLLAQDSCSSLLTHGIYDKLRTVNTAANASQASSQLCSAYNEMHQSHSSNGGSVSVFGYGSGSVQLTHDQLDAIGSYMCQASDASQSNSQNVETVKETIDQPLAAAYTECEAQASNGLKVTTSFDETAQDHIGISMYYSPGQNGQSSASLNGFRIDQPLDTNPDRRVTCKGSLVDAADKGKTLNAHVLNLTCSRPIVADPSQAFFAGGEKVLASPVTITIGTTAGAVSRTLEAVLPGPPLAPDLPIGSIVPMFLAPTELKALAPKWLPADGSTVADSNSPLFGHPLPNLVDRFVYGTSIARDVTNLQADSTLEGGSLAAVTHVDLRGQTDTTTLTDDHVQREGTGQSPYFVIDTAVDELHWSNHYHTFSLKGDAATVTTEPPYRRLVFMVKCR